MHTVGKALVAAIILTVIVPFPSGLNALWAKEAAAIRAITWETLLPVDERANFNPNPPPPVHSYLGEGSLPALQSGSYSVNPDLNDKDVKIPGFVVPLDTDKKGKLKLSSLLSNHG